MFSYVSIGSKDIVFSSVLHLIQIDREIHGYDKSRFGELQYAWVYDPADQAPRFKTVYNIAVLKSISDRYLQNYLDFGPVQYMLQRYIHPKLDNGNFLAIGAVEQELAKSFKIDDQLTFTRIDDPNVAEFRSELPVGMFASFHAISIINKLLHNESTRNRYLDAILPPNKGSLNALAETLIKDNQYILVYENGLSVYNSQDVAFLNDRPYILCQGYMLPVCNWQKFRNSSMPLAELLDCSLWYLESSKQISAFTAARADRYSDEQLNYFYQERGKDPIFTYIIDLFRQVIHGVRERLNPTVESNNKEVSSPPKSDATKKPRLTGS